MCILYYQYETFFFCKLYIFKLHPNLVKFKQGTESVNIKANFIIE